MVAIASIDNMESVANTRVTEGDMVDFRDKKRKAVNYDSPLKKKAKINKELYKQPTVEELNELRETENLFQSNLIRLQIEELLNSVKIKDTHKKNFKVWFDEFVKQLRTIKGNEAIDLNSNNLSDDCDIKIPFKNIINDYKGTFKYSPPSKIIIGGSHSLDTIVGPESSVDIIVEMPKNVFQQIDSKNYGYLKKKAMYLAYIRYKLNEELSQQISFTGNNLNPVLKIVPNKTFKCKKIVVYIRAVVQEGTFDVVSNSNIRPGINRFTPEKNNVRTNWLLKKTDDNTDANPPTPYYNSLIMQDLTALKTSLENIQAIKDYSNIRDGIILLKIWLRQRDYSNNFESFNGHIITMYVLYLLKMKELNTFMSSYQIVRNTWKNLANANWCNQGISLCKDKNIDDRINKYHEYFDCVFLDYTGFCNLAASIHEDTFYWISNQAKMSLECLNNTRVNGFQILFMQKVPLYRAFDGVICLHNVKAIENILDASLSTTDKLNYGPNKYNLAVNFVMRILKQGLGNKISAICAFPRKAKEWETNAEIPNDLEKFYIGLQFDPDTSYSIIEKGPGANLAEAGAFRKFWGDKSELRRFKDGTICETIVWAKENATLAQRREIPLKITKFLLEEKLKLFEKTHYFFFYNQIEDFLELKKIKVTKFNYGPEEAALQVINVFDSLEKEISNLSDLPLTINGVQGCSSTFRYTEIFPPLASVNMPDEVNVVAGETHLRLNDSNLKEVPRYIAPIDAVLQLSTSGKWPEDLEAFKVLKAEFYLQIAACMRNQYKLRSHATMDHIDIMKDGFVFRFRIAHQKEIGLVKKIVEDGVTRYEDNEESAELEKNMFYLPRITGALYGLHCQQPSFGPACCLVKRWLSAQLIDDTHMPDIVVELLMASMYLNSDPYKPAQSPQIAFLRFLEIFSKNHWNIDPIIVNFNNEMTREEILEVENLFGTSRDSLPPLFISTPYDKETSIWTEKSPSFLILNRISDLAKEALKLVETQLFTSGNVYFDPLFIPPTSAYDCVIELKKSLIARRFEAVLDDSSICKLSLHPYKEHSQAKIPVIGFDPAAEYLKALRRNYGDFSLFFHDTYGGHMVGVLLKPNVFSELNEKEFKNLKTPCQKLSKNGKLVFNVSEMIDDFYILGRGLIENIYVQSEKLKLVL